MNGAAGRESGESPQDHQNNAPELDVECIPNQAASKRPNGPFNCDPALRMKEFEAKKPASDPMVLLIVIAY